LIWKTLFFENKKPGYRQMFIYKHPGFFPEKRSDAFFVRKIIF